MDISPKQAALDMIEGMPDGVSLEDIMYELYFRQRVDRGLDELDQGRVVSQDEVKEILAGWLQSYGR